MRRASKLLALASLATMAAAPRIAAHREDTAILRIRAHFTRIEKEAPTYRCRSLDLDGFSAEGGTVEACYAGQELRRLSASYLGESGRASEKFYFWNDSLEFLFGTVEHYDRPLSGRVARTEEERLYWDGGNLIRWLKGTTRQAVRGPAATERSGEARETARKLRECAARMADSVCEA
ncbi:MAG TPA: hypothetical protein VF761_03680 [Gemmatimonadaceae bacterium]